MARRSRIRRLLMWAASGASVLTLLLLAYGCQHTSGLKDNQQFEIRLIADHLIVFWGPTTSWDSLASATWFRRPYWCSTPTVFLFSPRPPAPARSVAIPLWIVFIASGGLAGGLWLTGRHSSAAMRIRTGHCVHCGYNLTGNVSGVCPECGTAVASSKAGE